MEQKMGTKYQSGTVAILSILMFLLDIPRRLRFENISLMGIISLLILVLLSVDIVRARKFFQSSKVYRFWSLLLFNFYATISLFVSDVTQSGFQILVCYWSFYLSIYLAQKIPGDYILKVLTRVFPVILFLVALSYTLVTVFYSIGNSFIYGNRTIGIVLTFGMCCLTPYIKDMSILFKIGFCLLLFSVLLSKSRTASAVALLTFIVALAIGRKGLSKVKFVGLSISISTLVLLFLNSSAANYKWFFGGDTAIRYGNITISSQGRIEIWRFMMESASDSLLFGHGTGSSRELLNSHYFVTQEPHNEFIRVIYELGYVGLGLFIISLLSIFYAMTKVYLSNARYLKNPNGMAGLLGLALLVSLSITDNPMAYIFFVSPLGLLFGFIIKSFENQTQKGVSRSQPSSAIKDFSFTR